MSILNCPACASDQTQRLSAIVESGTSYTNGTSTGGFAGLGGGGSFGGVTSSRINTTTKSALATKLAAPARKPAKRLMALGALLAMFGIGSLFSSILMALVWLAGGGFLIYKGLQNNRYNNDVLPGEYARWKDTFYCHRCQNVYAPAGLAGMGGPVLAGMPGTSALPENNARPLL